MAKGFADEELHPVVQEKSGLYLSTRSQMACPPQPHSYSHFYLSRVPFSFQ
jgi:hypothetical protein